MSVSLNGKVISSSKSRSFSSALVAASWNVKIFGQPLSAIVEDMPHLRTSSLIAKEEIGRRSLEKRMERRSLAKNKSV